MYSVSKSTNRNADLDPVEGLDVCPQCFYVACQQQKSVIHVRGCSVRVVFPLAAVVLVVKGNSDE